MSSSNVNDGASHSEDRKSNAGRGGSSGHGQPKPKEHPSGEGTPQETPGPYALSGGGLPASAGVSQTNCEAAEPVAMQTSSSTVGQSNNPAFNLSGKSENINSYGGSMIYSGHGNTH